MTYSPSKFGTITFYKPFLVNKFKEYSKLFNWENVRNFRMMDIGTGPGHILREVEPLIPPNYEEIVAVDREADMLNHFKNAMKYPRISPKQFDIETKNLPKDLKGRFNFLFSCHCLMYVRDFSHVLHNCNQLLKPNGELFFFWAKICPPLSIYKTMSGTEKWGCYTSDFKDWNLEFDHDNADEIVSEKFRNAGLKVLKTEIFDDFKFRTEKPDEILGLLDSLDFVSKRIPQVDLPLYKEEYRRLASSYYTVDENAENGLKVTYSLPTIITGARKV